MQLTRLKKTLHEAFPPARREMLLLLLAGFLLALAVRYMLRGFISGDTSVAFVPWYERIKAEGLASFSHRVSNYPPLYLFSLFIVSKIFPFLSSVTAVKIPSIVCDFIAAYFAFQIIRDRFHSTLTASLAGFALLFAPTVILNGAAWGQTDMMFTCFLLGSLYYFQKQNPVAACVCVGLAFAIKLQAVFMGPFLLVLLLKRRVSILQLLLIPAVYLATILPSWLLGRSLLELLLIYPDQTSQFQQLTLHYPNLYAWLPNSNFDLFFQAGIVWTAGLVFLFVLLSWKSRQELSPDLLLDMALLSVLLLPFFLPTMHERYGFTADVFAILYAFYHPRRFYIPITLNLLSFFSYYPFLFQAELFPQNVLALFSLAALCLVVYFWLRDLYPQGMGLLKTNGEQV